jgi:low temperature requirement protein LtrA
VVLVHGGLFTVSTEVRLSTIYRGFFPVNVGFALLVVAGGALGGDWQYGLWTLAAVSAWTSPHLIADQSHLLGVHHFVERHALVVLVAIGESVVAVGIGANTHGVDAGTLVTIAFGMVISAGLWWAYFGTDDDELRQRGFAEAIAAGRRLVALGAYGLVFVAVLGGVVAVAAGLQHAIAHPGHQVAAAQALYLGGGVALFVLADQLSRRAMLMRVRRSRVLIAAAAVATAPVGIALAGGAQEALLAAVLVAGFWMEGRSAVNAAPT